MRSLSPWRRWSVWGYGSQSAANTDKRKRFRSGVIPTASAEILEPRQLLTAATGTDVIVDWNAVVLDAIRQDKTAPPKAARAMAMMHVAMYDAVNSIERTHSPYAGYSPAPEGASVASAAAAAARAILASIYPSQTTRFSAAFLASLNDIPDGPAEQTGIQVGQNAAQRILSLRAFDNSTTTVTYTPGSNPGDWQPTPPAFAAPALPQWPQVMPFAIRSASQFRPPAPPTLTSDEYTAAFAEVAALGRSDSSTRTADQTQVAQFWAGNAGTATPPGQWNQIAETISAAQHLSLSENARLFALINLSLADAGLAAWDAKYQYNEWRPMTAIVHADTDGNSQTAPDETWTPLLPTPNHPSYVSGHSTFSAAAASALAAFFGSDKISFAMKSDDLPGVTRNFTSFSQAAAEAGQSRIYGGIHWQFDNQAGLTLGKSVAQFISSQFLLRSDLVPVYRASNPNTAAHLFTTSRGEFEVVVGRGYRDESSQRVGFSVLNQEEDRSQPLYRLYNPNSGGHYYTVSLGEQQSLVQAGWIFERVEGYLFDTPTADSTEIFRLYNKQTGQHCFTADISERDQILSAFPGVWELHARLGYGFVRNPNDIVPLSPTPHEPPGPSPSLSLPTLSLPALSLPTDQPSPSVGLDSTDHATDSLAGLIASSLALTLPASGSSSQVSVTTTDSRLDRIAQSDTAFEQPVATSRGNTLADLDSAFADLTADLLS